MKQIQSSTAIKVPSGVTVTLDNRIVTVKGKLGTLTRDLRHIKVELTLPTPDSLCITVWFGLRKHLACVKTVSSLITNMIRGVMTGYTYRMKACATHFPIKMLVAADGKSVEIRNFLGEKLVRKIQMLEGVKVAMGEKDELVLSGLDVTRVSQSAALIQQSCAAKGKDIRKFLDGVYVSKRGQSAAA